MPSRPKATRISGHRLISVSHTSPDKTPIFFNRKTTPRTIKINGPIKLPLNLGLFSDMFILLHKLKPQMGTDAHGFLISVYLCSSVVASFLLSHGVQET